MTSRADMAESIAMIRQSAEGIADRGTLSRIRKLRYSLPGFDRGVWRQMCAMGWPALRTDEAAGGVRLPMLAYCALAEELGAALLPEPLIGAVLAASLLNGEALAQQLAGDTLFLPAWQNDRDSCTPDSELRYSAGRLTGRLNYVMMAGGADGFVVIAAKQAWLVAADADGLNVTTHEMQDGGHFGELVLTGAPAQDLGTVTAWALAEATLATAAFLMGVINATIERTADYLRTRVQFGKPIGSFQALQHRMVDLKLEGELTCASIDDAALRWEAAPGSDTALAAISRAKARASATALIVTRQAIQLHGGIGFTDEHDISLFLRKAMVIAPQFGSAALHRARFAQLQPYARD